MVYTFRKPEKLEHCLVFWSTTDGEKHAKAVKNLLHVTACRDLALLAAEVDDNPGEVCLVSLFFFPPPLPPFSSLFRPPPLFPLSLFLPPFSSFLKLSVIQFSFCIYIQYVLLLCNALGTPLESKYINMGELLTQQRAI